MTEFERYVFLLCLVVFLMLSLTFGFMIWKLYRMTVIMMREGLMDRKIRAESRKEVVNSTVLKIISGVVSVTVSLALLAAFGFSIYLNINDGTYFEDVPVLRVVRSSSMEKKHEKNTYLEKHGLNDQFAMFDLIYVYKAPAEEELKLYDIVVYSMDDDVKVVHRIVGIEEPNTQHPNERHFLLQGDAVERPDRFPVRYSQIEAIYRGERIPFVGTFISFMQSPAGWLCVLLAVISVVSSFWIERRLAAERTRRLHRMGTSVYLYDWNIQ